jgi:hypothetical protein
MRVLVCVLSVALLASCSESAAPPAEPPATVSTPSLAELALGPLAGAPIAGRLSGELGCSFSAGDDQLLLAMGFVASQERAEALVVRNGEVSELQATEEEGFDGLADGATFQGEGVSVEVAPGASIETGHEGVASNAALTLRADGQERVYEGVWGCGP